MKYMCIDCKKSLNSYAKYYKTKRCMLCENNHRIKNKTHNFVGKNNPSWKNGFTLKSHYCSECENLIKNPHAKRCRPCAQKIRNIGRKRPDQTKRMLGKNNPNWKGGCDPLPYSRDFTLKLREQIKERDNYERQNCGMTDEEHILLYSKSIEVHHIDYNKFHNTENNLITLCKQDNMRANHNREYWQNHYENIQKSREYKREI